MHRSCLCLCRMLLCVSHVISGNHQITWHTNEMCSSLNSRLFALCHDVKTSPIRASLSSQASMFTILGSRQMGVHHRVSIVRDSSIQSLRVRKKKHPNHNDLDQPTVPPCVTSDVSLSPMFELSATSSSFEPHFWTLEQAVHTLAPVDSATVQCVWPARAHQLNQKRGSVYIHAMPDQNKKKGM